MDSDDDLANALMRASADVAARPAFYAAVINADVFILGSSKQTESPATTTLAAGSKLQIRNWADDQGNTFIPFFSSFEKLQSAIREPQPYMLLPARALFETTLGTRLILNPRSDYQKEFLPGEVANLLSTGSPNASKEMVVEAARTVSLGQPADYPSRLVENLSRLFRERGDVDAAYLSLMHDPSQGEEPHLLIGILCQGDFSAVSRDAGVVIAETVPGEIVDVMRIEANCGEVSRYFLESVTPFFVREIHSN